MSRFNTPAAKSVTRLSDTHNRAGGQAYSQSDRMKLASILLTSFVQDQYYRGAGDTLDELVALIPGDPKFAAKAAIFARNEFGMRSISHVVAGEIPAIVKGEKWTKRFIDRVVHRPDDATEILAYYLTKYGKPVPNSLKKGLGLALSKFDAYQLAKYRGDKNAVSLVDILNLTHVKPSEKNAEVFAKLIDGELKSAGTWEQRISEAGKAENKKEAKSEAWADLVNTGKIGQFALLRNLRNIETQAPEVLVAALTLLVDEKRIRSSLILPFRYATALEQVSEQKTFTALNKALDVSTANVPKLDGTTLVAIDHSGSMGHGVGSHRYQADLLGAVLAKASGADVMVFGDTAKYVKSINTDDSTLTIMNAINRANAGHSTNFGDVFNRATKKYDRVVILSDMQTWVGYNAPTSQLKTYESKYMTKPFLYGIDLAGYGSTMFPDSRTFQLAGYSEKIFDIMNILEQDKDALVNTIEAVDL